MQWLVAHIPHEIALAILGALLKAAYPYFKTRFQFDPALWLWGHTKRALHISHRKRAVEAIRWLIVAACLGALLATYYGAVSFYTWMGPKEGDPADSPFTIDNHKFVLPNKEAGLTAGVNVDFTPTKAFTGCTKGVLLWPTVEISDSEMTENFRILVGEGDVLSAKECDNHFAVGQPTKTTAFPMPPSFLIDSQIAEIQNGTRNLYALFVWRYYLDSDPTAYFITEECVVISVPAVSSPQICHGNFNGTWRHIVN